MLKKRTTLYLTEESDCWIAGQARELGVSKNDVVQLLINREMRREGGTAANDADTAPIGGDANA